MTDTGSGMSEETRQRAFEPFFTTKGEGVGTGLGLSTVHGIVHQSGGGVWLESAPGAGTRVEVLLPQAQAPAPESTFGGARIAQGRGQLILFVEDEAPLRDVGRKLLERIGYRVSVADNGDAAARLVESEGLRPALLLTDVVMPGLGGRALADRLQAVNPALRVVYMSGYTDDRVVNHGVWGAQVRFLQKPFSAEALAETVRAALDE